jgi:hypothetical protein
MALSLFDYATIFSGGGGALASILGSPWTVDFLKRDSDSALPKGWELLAAATSPGSPRHPINWT